MKESDIVFVYMTAPRRELAESIGRDLVESRLAACVNMIDGMTSIYRWEGKLETGQEVVLIAKSREELVPAIVERVQALHDDDCPCIVALPVQDGIEDFLAWIRQETS